MTGKYWGFDIIGKVPLVAVGGTLLLDCFLQSDRETDSNASELYCESCAAHHIKAR